jgi:hypothetical protein
VRGRCSDSSDCLGRDGPRQAAQKTKKAKEVATVLEMHQRRKSTCRMHEGPRHMRSGVVEQKVQRQKVQQKMPF